MKKWGASTTKLTGKRCSENGKYLEISRATNALQLGSVRAWIDVVEAERSCHVSDRTFEKNADLDIRPGRR